VLAPDLLEEFVADNSEMAAELVSDPIGFIVSQSKTGDSGKAIELALLSMLFPELLEEPNEMPDGAGGTVEFTDVFVVADHYSRHGADPAQRERIVALMARLHVTSERLEQWSGISQAAVFRPVDWFFPAAHAQTAMTVCEEVWEGLFPVEVTPEYCFDVEAWNQEGVEIRIFYPRDWNDTASDKAWVGHARDALSKAMRTYSNDVGMRVDDLDLVFFKRNTSARVRAETNSWSRSGNCVIRAMPNAWAGDGDLATTSFGQGHIPNFKQTIAHETWHCVQGWNFRHQLSGPYLSGASQEVVNDFSAAKQWWVEGTAEYFANVVYPCNQKEWERISNLDENSDVSSLIELGYSNVVFFSHLGRYGHAPIIDVSRRMPTSGGFEEQYIAAADAGLGVKYHEFGEDYVDEEIPDSCPGTRMPVQPNIEEQEVQRGITRSYDLTRFTLHRRDLYFNSGEYNLEYSQGVGGIRSTVRELEDEIWTSPPTTVNAGCQYRSLRLVMTYARPEVLEQYFEIEETSPLDATPERQSRIDACLLGNWRATDESVQRIADWLARERLTGSDSFTENRTVSGTISGAFRRNGVVSGVMRDFTQEYVTEMNMGSKTLTVESAVIMNDTSGARYSAEDETLSVWDACSFPTIRAISKLNGNVMSDQIVDLEKISKMDTVSGFGDADGLSVTTMFDMPATFEMAYKCRGDRLSVAPIEGFGDGRPWIEFRKTSSP
jgi:hypothetical protein